MSWRFNLDSSPENFLTESLFDLKGENYESTAKGTNYSYSTPVDSHRDTTSVPMIAPPKSVDDIFSQLTQNDISSTQEFNKNCARFASRKSSDFSTPFKEPPDLSRGLLKSLNATQGANVRRSVQLDDPPQLEIEEEEFLYPEDSPEMFPSSGHGDSLMGSFNLQEHLQDYLPKVMTGRQDRSNIFTTSQQQSHNYDNAMSTPNAMLIPAQTPSYADKRGMLKLRSTMEIPENYRSVFSQFPCFNIVQSRVLDEVFYTDRPLVVCAPTGSGKTVIFELAIIRLIMKSAEDIRRTKIVYMAPMKALCSERCTDWAAKFGPLGIKCKEVTGDSELDDYFEIRDVNIVMTTPEKWDSMTRKWKDNQSLVQSVQLFLIDEVHLLNDEDRGATVEAVISRMKTVQTNITRNTNKLQFKASMRLIAISATIPNVEDIAAWLGSLKHPASSYSMDDSYRPVKLRKVVLGFPMHANMSEFKFDLSLNYKISGIVHTYSDQKPTLVFCSTRKGTQQAASTLTKDARFIINSQHRQRLQRIANSLHDSKLRELVICGVGYHHAGLDPTDRKNIEALFVKGDLPVLFATSTLAVGVNLPAHLVIIKSTQCYDKGVYVEYSETQILQMIGRAGRPQFDTSATAVILTTTTKKDKYSSLLHGTQQIESSLHRHLIEHLNAEIVLHTITDVSVALEWLKSTFLFIRIQKNPTYYGIPEGLKKEALEHKLQDMCIQNLNTLERSNLVKMEDGFDLKPSEPGCLMARYYIAFDSIKEFLAIQGTETLSDMVILLSKCKEFADVKLRVSEKRILNTLNKDKHKATVRFPVNGKIKTTDQKINCLIQATLGCLPITEFSLNQDVTKIFRSGQRVTRCLMELLMLRGDYRALQNAILVTKCMKSRLWENSLYVSRQLEKVGMTLSTMLVNAGLTTFKKIEETNPREIELIVNRHPPFGSQIRDAVLALPKYEVSVEQKGSYTPLRAELVLTVTMTNHVKRQDSTGSRRNQHFCILLVGDADNRVVCKQRLGDSVLLREGAWSRRLDVRRASKSPQLNISVISQDYVGLDVNTTYTPYYSGSYFPTVQKPLAIPKTENKQPSEPAANTKTCNHRCLNKEMCGHECCKPGIGAKSKRSEKRKEMSALPQPMPFKRKYEREDNKMSNSISQLHKRTYAIPRTPSATRLKFCLQKTCLLRTGSGLFAVVDSRELPAPDS
ncbi:probable ATP-dependent DNA helicase HFM1 isoform X2 [Nematostella vectensis]|uniref:probable ATP-dependent DNA helicase HFM1 isoform X2 n=1 Tax=Nematostella vectensis TaxID=45351 RepID=UPI0020772049|nr:probable ATP-dependent DNA helicase HFM1 isoform X2 [Nematostella vectensis]